jgi:hypothetical protein
MLDPSMIGGLAGALTMVALGAIPFLVGWGRLHTEVEALKQRVAALELETNAITHIREDVAFIRGQLQGPLA